MDIFEITGFETGVSREGVNFLQPSDSFQNVRNGYIYRQVLQSRKGFKKFSKGWNNGVEYTGHLATRVMAILQNVLISTSDIQTLAFDKNFAYKYDEGTNSFVRIPFNARLLALDPTYSFNINDREDYISGTTYPDKKGTNRFVFTGKGMSSVYFYNGTDIGEYTNTLDNTDYVSFVGKTLDKATHVLWFGERLNFIAPTLSATLAPQAILYSGIRDSSGNGDSFNAPGSGLLEIDTYELIKGVSILGDRIALNVSQSSWIVEKTNDAFNPYFTRKIPSVLGTDASFSSTQWNNEVRSIGKTGIITTDGRQSLRIDNKIPYFTDDEIDALEFEQTYGGFDRVNAQFLWSYVDSSNDVNSTQNKVLVNNYEEKSWSVYDQRFSCFGESISGQNLIWSEIDEDESLAWETWDTTEETWRKIGISKETQKTLAGDDLGFIYELNQDFDDYFVAVESPGITKATACVISTVDQSLQIGDRVIVGAVLGMTEINDKTGTITASTISSVTVDIDTTSYSTWTSGGYVTKLINFYAETIPFNPYRDQGRKIKISHVEFLINTNNGSLNVDIFMDGEAAPFKSDILLRPTSTRKDREWVSVSINNTADFMVLALKQESATEQVKITSIRIHAEMAGLTTD
tara:strand:- start:1546 stop:3441 length:1896 start_codon:yes stop_codon:yes gene_type:complete